MRKLFLIAFAFGLLSATTGFTQTRTAQVKQIDTLAKTIDIRTKRAKASKLIFADISDFKSNAPAKWQRFASEKALERYRDKSEAYTIAYVWLERSKVASTNFTLFSPSGDWVKYVYSYFRPGGSLARVETDFRTFNGDFKVIRRRYFDSGGKEISRSAKFLDLQSGKPKKAPGGVMGDDPDEVDYSMTAEKLPFIHLLKKK